MNRLCFPLNIEAREPRPIFYAYINDVSMKCMLDTGANIPVYCKGIKMFKTFQPLMKNTGEVSEFGNSFIGGFGKDTENAVIWNIENFVLSDENKANLVYKNFKIALMHKPSIPCDIILSASMFMKMRYLIDCSSTEQSLVVESDKNTYGTGFYSSKESIYIFMEN